MFAISFKEISGNSGWDQGKKRVREGVVNKKKILPLPKILLREYQRRTLFSLPNAQYMLNSAFNSNFI